MRRPLIKSRLKVSYATLSITLSMLLITGCQHQQRIPVQQQIPSNLSTFAPMGVKTYQGEPPDLSNLPIQPGQVTRRVLEDVHHEVVSRFRYRDEDGESWTGGFEGDCDDFAITAQQVLAELGIQSDLVFAMVPQPDGERFGHLFTRVGEYALDNRFSHLQRMTDLPYEFVSYGQLGEPQWRKFITATRYLTPEEHAQRMAYVPPKASPAPRLARREINLETFTSAMGNAQPLIQKAPVLRPFQAVVAEREPTEVLTPRVPAPVSPVSPTSPQPIEAPKPAPAPAAIMTAETPQAAPSFMSLMRQNR